MRKYLLLVCALILISSYGSLGQPLPCPPTTTSLVSAGAPATICPGTCTTLHGFDTASLKSTSSYIVDTTAYQPYSFTFGTSVLVGIDDTWSGVIQLPFEFCFFGQKYTQCVIGSNGQVSFDASVANTYNSWPIAGPIPGINGAAGSSVLNVIMAPFQDIHPGISGNIRWAVYGTAPCRTFVVSWDSIPMYSCTNLFHSSQIVLYESTYAIDIFLKNKPLCSQFNNGFAILGIQNATGTQHYTPPGLNGTQWTAINKGYRFTPDGTPSKTLQWRNLNNGVVLGNADSVLVCPSDDTTYYEFQAIYASQCDSIILKDTVAVYVDKASVADFTYDILYGCSEDTVVFTNNSVENTFNVWTFGDGTGDTAVNPTHIYNQQGIYNVKLVVSNNICTDSLEQQIDTQHPLEASFTGDLDSICQGTMVTFTNTSTYTEINAPASFFWDFGDGATDTSKNATHVFNRVGEFDVMLVVTDFVPCSDTAWFRVVVDTLPSLDFKVSDSIFCEGQRITLEAEYSDIGNTGIFWDLGDGHLESNVPIVSHAYDSSGTYLITLTATYRICPDLTESKTIEVQPFPTLNLGADTTLCPNGEALLIGDLVNQFTSARWLWNTGDTTAFIAVRHPGIYTASVSRNGCSTADSVEIFKDCYLNIPNSFTPNGDGQNDYFLPRQLLSSGVTGFKMTIFNRWGQVIFETVRTDGRGWDGRFNGEAQPTGVYIYQIEATFKNGVREQYTGNVTLLR